MSTDPLRHPDLSRLDRNLRSTFEEVAEAEQAAAREMRNRQRTMRDRLLEASDRSEELVVGTVDGQVWRGRVTAVGVDHAVLLDGGRERFIAIGHMVSLDFR